MNKSSIRFDTLKFFFHSNKRQVSLLVVMSLIVGLLESASVAVVYPLLNVAFSGGVVRDNFLLTAFSRLAELIPITDTFISYCLLFIILAGLSFLFRLLFIRYRVRFSGTLVQKAQQDIYSKFIGADYQYYIDHKQGEMIYNVMTAPVSLQTLINYATELLSQVVLSISVLVLLFSLSWQGTLVFLFMGFIYYIFTVYLSNKVSYSSGVAQREAARESNVILSETIDGIKQLKVFAMTVDWLRKFTGSIATRWYHFIRIFTWQQALVPVLMLVLYLFIGGIALIIRVMFPDSFGTLIPIFGTFAFAVFRMVPIMTGITSAIMQVMASLPNCEAVYQIMNERLATISDGVREIDAFKSGIRFIDVTFSYKGREKIMDGVSLTFEKGRTTAIVGGSGSGKTTAINLILRLFDVDGGSIEIDGVDIRQYKLASWLVKIGFVSQETFIFNDTIKNNITFGSNYSEDEIVKVCHYANAHGFISELPDGYETLVGDKGMALSGGQKQRIAVARAMIRNPEILIFDEATNALDAISEAAVQRAIDEIARDHTAIIIAHRLSSIVNADKIVVLGNGNVLEEGTHRELMAKGGAYSNLYRSQIGN
jgi:ABC-type multidrug transport system fused ATPase/permease subunit